MSSFPLLSLPDDVVYLIVDQIGDWQTLHELFNTSTFFRSIPGSFPRRFARYWSIYNVITGPDFAEPGLSRAQLRIATERVKEVFGPGGPNRRRLQTSMEKSDFARPARLAIDYGCARTPSYPPYHPHRLIIGNRFYKHEDCGICGTMKPTLSLRQRQGNEEPQAISGTSLPLLPNGSPLYSTRYIVSHLTPVARVIFKQMLQDMGLEVPDV